MPDLHAGFREPSAGTLRDRIAFLDQVDELGHVTAIKTHMRELLGLRPGQRVLDVGCGMGHELTRLAAEVTPGGTVIGVDLSSDMVAGTRRRAAHLGSRATAIVGDAQHLALPDAWADAVHAERVCMYVRDAERAIGELVRVTRPRGRVTAFELDYGATIVDLPDHAVAGRVLEVLAASIPHRWMGRSLG